MEEVSSSQVVLLGALYNTAQEYDTSATWEYTGPQLELVTCLLVLVLTCTGIWSGTVKSDVVA